jgi:hypothetical protein
MLTLCSVCRAYVLERAYVNGEIALADEYIGSNPNCYFNFFSFFAIVFYFFFFKC